MDANQVLGRNELFSTMNRGTPYKSYKKTILGKVAVQVWDNFLDKPVDIILKGDPKRMDDTSIVDTWSEKEDIYFRRANKRHFSEGIIIEFNRPSEVEPAEKPIEQYSDDELKEVINKKFLALNSIVKKINSVAVLFRMRSLAEEMEKSVKITGAIENRISALQNGETEEETSEEE